jgi:phage FluMu protein Com
MKIEPTLPNPKEETFVKLRCADCDRLIAEARGVGFVLMKCKRCGSMNEFKIESGTAKVIKKI